MLFLDEIEATRRNIKLQIFATEVDEDALAFAREGLYPASIAADVPPARLTRYFTKEGEGYRVSRDLRSAVVFSLHDLVADAPFSRLDLVSCRNLLIYLRPEVQQKVLSLFRFALRGGGVLFLGLSESVRGAADQFEPISEKQRIYRHVWHGRPGEVELPIGQGTVARTLWQRHAPPAEAPQNRVADLVQRLLIEGYAPASVLVNRKRLGVYFSGATDLYLRMPQGVGTLDVLAAAREGLRPAIRVALDGAGKGSKPTIAVAGQVTRDGRAVPVTVRAQTAKSDGEDLILLSFLDEPEKQKRAKAVVTSPADASRNAQLAQELDATHKELEDAIREREIAEEEMRAINEEAMSVNEEFQSTNEELETSKEELQSLNEELTALNGQLQETLDEHKAVANDLENILNSADLATLFLDEKLNIRFFTPSARSLFSVIASDVGRPLADLTHHFADGDLLAEAKKVLADLVPITHEIEAENGASYSCRILPYRTKENRIEGVVITFVDVTARKRAEDAANAAKIQAEQANLGKSRFLAAASHDLRQPLQTLSLLQGVLAKRLTDEAGIKLIARLEETIGAMSGMLNSLLDINQLEAGIVRPEIVEFRVDELLERLKTEFAYHAAAKGLDWRVVTSRVMVRSDPRLLEEMLRNLLSNAMKYTERGAVLLGCRRHEGKLRIEVWDRGKGIPSDHINAIFEEFHQVDNATRQRNRGLGLGLSIVKRICDLLGHTVDVRSKPGIGSAFAIEVPLAKGKRRAGRRIGPNKAKVIARLTGDILIVEDDPAVREMLEVLLVAEGHRTTAFSSAAEAFATVARGAVAPDVIVTDYNLLGDVTGIEVIAQLRESLQRQVPALVLTGDISTDTLHAIDLAGCAHLYKPAEAEELTQEIQALFALTAKRRPKVAAGEPEAVRPAGEVQPTIFVVDDDPIVLETMQALLREHGRAVEAYGSGSAFLDAYRTGRKGCLVVDAIMPGMSGIELLERLKAEGRYLPAIVITGQGDTTVAVAAMKAGALDFLEKPVPPRQLLACIDDALHRAQHSVEISVQRREEARARLARLTPRERDVMDLVIQGKPNKIISEELGISQRTVEIHRAGMMKHARVKSLPDLVRLVMSTQ